MALRGVEDGVSSDAALSKYFFQLGISCQIDVLYKKGSIVPAVIDGWVVMTDNEKDKLLKMNDFLWLASHSRNSRPGRSST